MRFDEALRILQVDFDVDDHTIVNIMDRDEDFFQA